MHDKTPYATPEQRLRHDLRKALQDRMEVVIGEFVMTTPKTRLTHDDYDAALRADPEIRRILVALAIADRDQIGDGDPGATVCRRPGWTP